MINLTDSCCAWVLVAAVAILVILVLGSLFHIYRYWVPASYRVAVWWLLALVLVAFSLFNKDIRDFTAAFGTLAAVLSVVWKDQVLNLLNPAEADFDGDPKQDPDSQTPGGCFKLAPNEPNENLIRSRSDPYYDQYHLRVKNLNPGRVLENVSVVFEKYEVDGAAKEIAVPRQFTWAPHECEPRYAVIPDHKVLDLFYYKPGLGLFLIIYSGLKYDGGEVAFNCIKGSQIRFFIEIRASNLTVPLRRILNVFRVGEGHQIKVWIESEDFFD